MNKQVAVSSVVGGAVSSVIEGVNSEIITVPQESSSVMLQFHCTRVFQIANPSDYVPSSAFNDFWFT